LSLPTKTELEQALKTQAANMADLAVLYDTTVWELQKHLESLELPLPSIQDEPFAFCRSQRFAIPEEGTGDFELLFYDDTAKTRINGAKLNSLASYSPSECIKYYHKGDSCYYCGKASAGLAAHIDGNPQNILITNLIPICDSCISTRQLPVRTLREYVSHVVQPDLVGDRQFYLHIYLLQWLDPKAGQGFMSDQIPDIVQRWVVDPIEKLSLDKLLPLGVLATSEAIAVWAWQQLSTAALIKGLSRIDVSDEEGTVSLTVSNVLSYFMHVVKKHMPKIALANSQVPLPGKHPFSL
jgi:hypothetical protein